MSVALLLVTNGRGELLAQTVASVRAMVRGLGMTLICDDSGDPAFADSLRRDYPAAVIDAHPHVGHGPAIARAWSRAALLPAEWVLWMEEDMLVLRPLDLGAVAEVIKAAGLAQMVFKRNSHFPLEVAAGPTVISRFDPGSFTERETDGHPWLDHRLFYSLNPHLVSTAFLRGHEWPAVPNSEHHFSRRLFRDRDAHVGMWEGPEAPPIVLHAGTERTGSGY